jgi:ferredoxin
MRGVAVDVPVPERITTVTVDREACIGAQNCLFWAPGVFEIDDDGLAVVIGDVTAVPREQLVAAATECPTQAIQLGA